MDRVAQLLLHQDGVISRRQALAAGLAPTQVARAVRRREWTVVHPGVYVDHTGPLTWQQRAWAAVLACWPSALSLDSALRAADGPGRRHRDESTIQVAIDRHRRLCAPDGVQLHRMTGYAERVRWNLGPPRVCYDDSVLDVAALQDDDLAAVAVLADACGSRRTTAQRLLDTLAGRCRIGRRAWLEQVLTDVASGTCSVLEHGYLTRVERPHGLPVGSRQVRRTGPTGAQYSDVEYDELGVIVELDGRLFHSSSAARDRDLERDLDSAAGRRGTVRLGYAQVFDRPCTTASKVGQVLRVNGWTGQLARCPDCPSAI